MKPQLIRFLLPAVLATATPCAYAGPLQQAAVNQIVNDVKVVDPAKGARPAALKEIIRDDLAVRTGIQSRTELLFQDDTLTRLGAETIFSFKAGSRDLKLDRGTMLLQVPKDHGGARIHARRFNTRARTWRTLPRLGSCAYHVGRDRWLPWAPK